ncbi:MAG: cytochrome b/b6 domain-containing protein [Coriobacteriia bacterium]|nr:cytochrome b/b6 domain-containing protein [Coriobacteriia bacterium]
MAQYIKRHDALARLNHWVFAICGMLLGIGGAFMFFPFLHDLVSPEFLRGQMILHRILGGIFVAIPIISWIIRPSNFVHTFKNIFSKWTSDDLEFMKKFLPYLFNPKKVHMPKQDFIKSGQRISDAVMYLLIFVFMITGVLMWIDMPRIPEWLFNLSRLGHDLAFFGWACLMVIHLYLGAGIFQPYRGSARFMFGDGYASAEDAKYHWGHWADQELATGENVKEM